MILKTKKKSRTLKRFTFKKDKMLIQIGNIWKNLKLGQKIKKIILMKFLLTIETKMLLKQTKKIWQVTTKNRIRIRSKATKKFPIFRLKSTILKIQIKTIYNLKSSKSKKVPIHPHQTHHFKSLLLITL